MAFVVESVGRDYNLNRFERYFAIVGNSGVKPAIVLNKIDLIPAAELDLKLAELTARFPGTGVILTSTLTDQGLNELRAHILCGKTYCFLGSSGVGKSSLINKLLGENIIKTEDISLGTGRGKHVTTNRQMYFLENGGIVIDNPGMREVGMTDTRAGIDSLFAEITSLAGQCKYADCSHTHEQGCAVLASVRSGQLDESKYSNYINLKKEAKYYELSELEKREKDREFGKFLQQAKKELKRHGHKDY